MHRARLTVLAAVPLTSLPALAQLTVGGEVFEGSPPNLVRSQWDKDPKVTVYTCPLEVPGSHGLAEVKVGLSNDNGDTGVAFKLDVVNKKEELVKMFTEMLLDGLEELPCNLEIVEDYGHVRGGIHLYSFAVGGGIGGGFTYTRLAKTSLEFSDTFQITSEGSATIELPLELAAGLSAAESFGDPFATKATAKVSLVGSFGGQEINESAEIESVTVIPEQAKIGFAGSIPITLQPGLNIFPIALTGSVEAEATAVSAGFYGFISGSADIIVDFPDSIRIGRFTGEGGGPLPAGIEVRSTNHPELVYESTFEASCRADLDGNGTLDLFDFLTFVNLFNAGDAKADCTGDGVFDLFDFLCFVNSFNTGC